MLARRCGRTDILSNEHCGCKGGGSAGLARSWFFRKLAMSESRKQ
jgi:hypothetical protein